MHKIYQDKPQIIYSTLISSASSMILEFLALSEGNILNNNKEKRNWRQRITQLNKLINIKFILYFIISFIFLFFLVLFISFFPRV